jgi:hypothetical protein
MSENYDEEDDIFRKEQLNKIYAESKPLREKYKPRELTDEEILEEAKLSLGDDIDNIDDTYILLFARSLLKKASEK